MMPGMGGPPPPPMMPGMGGPPMMPGMGGPPPPPMLSGMSGPPPPPMIPGMVCPPPPPGMPGPPPPPGQYGRPTVAIWPAQRKPVIQPKTSMKPLYWSRIQISNNPTGMPGTLPSGPLLWEQLEDVEVGGELLEDLFGKAAPKPKSKEEKKPSADKVMVVKLIDGKKSQNIGIFLKSNKLDIEGVKQIVYECDCSWEIESLIQLQG